MRGSRSGLSAALKTTLLSALSTLRWSASALCGCASLSVIHFPLAWSIPDQPSVLSKQRWPRAVEAAGAVTHRRVIPMDEKTIARFWSYVERGESTECWIWLKGFNTLGYGRFWYGGSRVAHPAHRISWELANGDPVPAGKVICHRCDNPGCVNPSHLVAGTASENMRDMSSKGRHRAGPHRSAATFVDGRRRLSFEQKFEMCTLLDKGVITLREAAERYGIRENTARETRRGRPRLSKLRGKLYTQRPFLERFHPIDPGGA
jgi:hypothetical protein